MNKRLVFMDGEFTKLTSKGVKFLSIAFISDTHQKLYIEIDQSKEKIDSWVIENVLPFLNETKVTQENAN